MKRRPDLLLLKEILLSFLAKERIECEWRGHLERWNVQENTRATLEPDRLEDGFEASGSENPRNPLDDLVYLDGACIIKFLDAEKPSTSVMQSTDC